MMGAATKKWIGILVRLALVGVIFVLIGRKLDMQAAANAVREARFGWLLAAFGLFLLNRLMTAAKWGVLLKQGGVDAGFWPLVRIMFESNLLGILIPSGFGPDAARLFQLAREKNALTASAGSVLADRMLAVLTLAAIAVIAAVTMWTRVPDRAVLVYVLLIAVALSAVILTIMADVTFRVYARMHRAVARALARRRPGASDRIEQVSERVLGKAARIHGSLAMLRRNRRLLSLSIGMNIVVQVFRVIQVHFLFLALATHVPFILQLAFVPVIILIGLMPFCPYMGLGVHEVAYITFFGGVGVTSEIAFSTSMLGHVVVLVGCIPGAVLFLARRRTRHG